MLGSAKRLQTLPAMVPDVRLNVATRARIAKASGYCTVYRLLYNCVLLIACQTGPTEIGPDRIKRTGL